MKKRRFIVNESFKDYAKRAKNRLAGGYWQEVKLDQQKFLKEREGSGDIENLKQMYQKRIQKEIYSTHHENPEDEKFYKKVAKLLSENEYVLNPIMRLINHNEFDNLSDGAKQNYIFKLTDKYNEMKRRYEREQKEKIVFGR